MKIKLILPLLVFLGLVVFLAFGLTRDPHAIPSPLVGKVAPAFTLPQLRDPQQSFSPAQMRGQVWVLNVWASWCAACREEHPFLLEMAKAKVAPLVGLNYKDERADALAVLAALHDPYVVSAFDQAGRVGIDYGVYGVPETYVIDQMGVIRYKHIGPLTAEVLNHTIYPLIDTLKKS